MIKKYVLTIIIILGLMESGSGQSFRPFPQNVNYQFGYKPSTVASAEAQNTFNKLKELYLTKCNDGFRINCEGKDETRVEAIGFAMILTAYFGEKEIFDGLFKFYKSKRTKNANNMMAWNVSCKDINDPGSATDGDIDVAFSLIVASNQWEGNYFNEAKKIIHIIKNSVLITCDSLLVLAPGYSKETHPEGIWGGCDLTDIQYYTPAYFRLFAEASGDNDWNKLADDTYTILNNGAHPETGLVPDWQNVNGEPGGNSNRISFFRYDACRVPWRIAIDYLWNGNEPAKNWCTKVSNWAYNIGPENIKDGYNLDGTENNHGNHNSAFVGGFSVSAMCNSQLIADAFGKEMISCKIIDDHWFMMCTRSVYLLPITGNFWKPVIPVRK